MKKDLKLLHLLSGKERRVMKMRGMGFSREEIADKMGTSAKMVEVHRSNCIKRLRISGSTFSKWAFLLAAGRLKVKRKKGTALKKELKSLHLLSERELQIVRMRGMGISSVEIADKMGLSPKTIDAHRSNCIKKLGIISSTFPKWAFRLAAGLLKVKRKRLH